MKTKSITLVLPLLLAFGLSAAEIRTGDRQSEAAELAKQADDKLHQAGSSQDYQEAAALLEKSVKLDPGNMDVRETLGWVYLDRLHDPNKAYPHLARLAKNRPDDVNARKLFGLACIQTGRSHRAVEQFRAAQKLQPDDLWIRANLGRALARAGKLSEAEQIYAEVLQAEPGNVDARLGQAEIQAWRGHTTVPLETLDQLARESSTNTDVLILRGDIHRWNWDLAEARQDYQQVLNVQENNRLAMDGLEETERMGASSVGLNAYWFKDSTDFLRESIEVAGRVRVTDNVYLLGSVAGWRFDAPGISQRVRLDASAGVEVDWARWIQTTARAQMFDYGHKKAFIGGEFSTKISPMTGLDLYGVVAGNQPFISSIATVDRGLRQHSIGVGVDATLVGPLSFQVAAQAAEISDDNHWYEIKPQLSYRLFDRPKTFLRVEYDYLSYEKSRPDYWTPHHRSTAGPVLDTSIPICRVAHFDISARAPYVFSKSELGWQVEGGPTVEIVNRVQLKASYFYSDIPGDEGAWSGYGWRASVLVRF